MRNITFREALIEAQAQAMRKDDSIIILGEDIRLAYAFGTTLGLVDEFGEDRVIDTPISENGFVGVGVGAAMTGLRPIIEIQISDLLPLCMDQIVNQAAKLRYMTGGNVKVPLVVRTPGGCWSSFAAHHSQCLESWFMHVPGLKVVLPSSPYDAKGLLLESIKDDNPVLFFEHKKLYQMNGHVPEEEYTIPLGLADVKKEGSELTLVSFSYMVNEALKAAEELQDMVDIEVVDIRTISPLDKNTIIESVKKTGKLLIVEEACKIGGVGAEVSALIAEKAIGYLDAPVLRVGMPHVPHPFSPVMENEVIPDKDNIIQAVNSLMKSTLV